MYLLQIWATVVLKKSMVRSLAMNSLVMNWQPKSLGTRLWIMGFLSFYGIPKEGLWASCCQKPVVFCWNKPSPSTNILVVFRVFCKQNGKLLGRSGAEGLWCWLFVGWGCVCGAGSCCVSCSPVGPFLALMSFCCINMLVCLCSYWSRWWIVVENFCCFKFFSFKKITL